MYHHRIIAALAGILFFLGFVQAQTNRDKTIFAAMNDELQRNMDSLYIPGWEKPFLIQYAVQEGQLFQVQATMGALTGENEFPVGSMSVQTLVGNYQLANINLSNTDYRSGGRNDVAPIDHDYAEIRRRLWLLTDNTYKAAIEEYSNKMSSIKQLNLPEDVLELPDLIKLSPVYDVNSRKNITYDKKYWEKVARDCSAVFKKYTKIYGSNAGVEIYSGTIYSLNSEGIKLQHTTGLITLAINAYTKLEDGDVISDRLAYYGLSEADLPPLNKILQDIDAMASHIIALAKAPKITESYTGPVLLEGPVLASEFVTGLLTPQTGLVAYRVPLKSSRVQRLMEERLNRRVLPSGMMVKSIPHTQTYHGQTLIGSYEVDAEGITPKEELILVEDGMLRALLCDRVPTRKISNPTGNRIYTYQPQSISTRVSPGVLLVGTTQGMTCDEMKSKLLEAAKKEGQDYAFIARSLPYGRSVSLYKVQVSDGSEELVRAGVISDIGLGRLKHALGTSLVSQVLNMIAGGVPVSIICPNAMLIEEADIEKENLQNTTKLPTVDNPLE